MGSDKEATDSQKGSQKGVHKGERKVLSRTGEKKIAASKPAGRGKGRPAGRKPVSRSTKSGLQVPHGKMNDAREMP